MINFKELPSDGDDFELLVRELLYNKGLEVYWSGKGADGGKDLLCIETHRSCFKSSTQRWLVQCKHNAHSGRAVNKTDLDSIVDSCAEHNATGYLLACSTFPSSNLVKRLEEIQNTKGVTTQFWDCRTLERELMKPENWGIANMFFPRSLKDSGWKINSIEPSFWYASYNGSIFYIATRISANTEFCLPEIEKRIHQINQLSLPTGHFLRLRAIYIDDKHCNYTMYLDHLTPVKEDESEAYLEFTVSEFERNSVLDGIYYNFDIMTYRYNPYSDYFDKDSNSYYSGFLHEFKHGWSREGKRKYAYAHGLSSRELTEETTNDVFDSLVKTFRQIPYIRVLSSFNAKIEFIDQFTENFAWNNQFSSADYHVDNFFNSQIRFICDDFDALIRLLNILPNNTDNYFQLSKNYIFTPEDGLDIDEDSIFTLNFSVHPALITSKHQFRKALNNYLMEIKAAINEVFNQPE